MLTRTGDGRHRPGRNERADRGGVRAHRFAAGHRLRVQVSGGAHPRWARNTGTAEQIATATILLAVHIGISHRESVLWLPVLLAGAIGYLTSD